MCSGRVSARSRQRRCSEPTRAWTWTTGSSIYLLGEAEAVAARIRDKIDALGGVDHLVLNPLDWNPAHLEVLATEVLPRVVG